MFSKEYSFKYSDINNKGSIKISTVIDLLQDVSISHSAAVGYNLKKMQEIHIAMLLHGWTVRFLKPIDYESPVTMKTGITKVHRIEVTRKYEIIQDGEVKAIATGSWFSFDSQKQEIVRVPEEINCAYDSVNEEDNGIALAKLRPDSNVKEFARTFVTRRDLDTNNHMNNVKSVEAALDYLPDSKEINELDIIYVKQLLEDDEIIVCTHDSGDSFIIELHNQSNEPCVLVSVK